VFISPPIADLLRNDSTLDGFSLNYSDSCSFEFLCEFMVGSSMMINRKRLRSVNF
jgi:hypothetical protein